MMMGISREATRLMMYRQRPSLWVRMHFEIELAKYRGQGEVEQWLEQQPPGSHEFLRQEMEIGSMVFDSTRSYQAEALDLLADPRDVVRVVLRWGNSCAKTTTASLMLHWFLDCWPGGVCVSTAGTWSQLKEQLWGEIGMWGERTTRPICSGTVPIWKTHIDLGPQWKAFGRAAKDEGTFEGVHADYVMILFDEAKAIPQGVWDQARRIMRGAKKVFFIVMSTPGSPSGAFYDICMGDLAHRWTDHVVTAYESERLTLSQVTEDYEDLGGDSPLFVSMVCAGFPDEGENTVLPLSLVQSAVARHGIVSQAGDRHLGIDVARFGSDETVAAEIRGHQANIMAYTTGKDTQWTTGKALELFGLHNYKAVGVDDTGIGGAVVDGLRPHRIKVVPIYFGSKKTLRKELYYTARTEMMFMIKAALEAGAAEGAQDDEGLGLPNDKKLIHQAASQQYVYGPAGQFWVKGGEDKSTTSPDTGTTGKSPDRLDAVLLAHYASIKGRGTTMRAMPHNIMPSAA
jgi:hypothetical protein